MGSQRRPIARIAHRGNSYARRENTLAAFSSAIDAGCDWLEIDVRTTRDGRSVVVHDPTLRRLWGLPAPVSDLDLHEVRSLGIADQRIPTLSEVLDLAAGTGVGALIDGTTVEDLLTAHDQASRVMADQRIMFCGATEAMIALRHRDSRVRLQYGYRGGPLDLALLDDLGPDVVNAEWCDLSAALIDQIHTTGRQVWAWTVNDPGVMRWLTRLGIDGITTDRVRLLNRILHESPPYERPVALPPTLPAADLDRSLGVAAALADLAISYTRDAELGRVVAKAHAADVVTAVDTSVEAVVRQVVAEELPGHLLVGEEEGGESQPGVPTWYLDPVDGTTNLANRIPWTSFSLALAVDDQPCVAAVAHPWTGDVFLGALGRGATARGETLTLSGTPPLRVLLTELDAHQRWPGFDAMLDRAADDHVTVRIMGSGTLTLSGVAAGWGQAAVIHAFSAVDHLAALLLVHEAGGVIWDDQARRVVFPEPGTPILVSHPATARQAYLIWRGRDRPATQA